MWYRNNYKLFINFKIKLYEVRNDFLNCFFCSFRLIFENNFICSRHRHADLTCCHDIFEVKTSLAALRTF